MEGARHCRQPVALWEGVVEVRREGVVGRGWGCVVLTC